MKWWKVRLEVPEENAADAAAALAELGVSGVQVEATGLETHFGEEKGAACAEIAKAWGGRVAFAGWVEEEDWATAWQKRAPAMVVGGFCIHPSHEAPRAGKVNFRIDAGMAFGTGAHPTTRLMLLEIEAMAAARPLGRFLDLGCGTGVLAMAAVALGATEVVAADTDEKCVTAARENAANNGMAGRIVLIEGSLDRCAGKFDTIVANLTSDLHERFVGDYPAKLAPGGRLRLGGIRDEESEPMAHVMQARELRRESGWVILGN